MNINNNIINIINKKYIADGKQYIENCNIIYNKMEEHTFIKLDTHIFDFFKENKLKYNIWKLLNISEYIHYNESFQYDKRFIIRLCLSYSWKECLYDLLIKCLNNSDSYKTFIWIDIFCVNQFNDYIKNKGLNRINDIYYVADIYDISSLEAFKRYWCCYEMSLKKKLLMVIY